MAIFVENFTQVSLDIDAEDWICVTQNIPKPITQMFLYVHLVQ
jgi:hypothetical protein